MLEISLADDAGLPMTRPLVVRRRKLFQPQHPFPAPRQVPRRLAPHPAQTDNDDIIVGHSKNQCTVLRATNKHE